MHIFISYSKKNKDYAQRLKTKLLSEGFDVWIDDRIYSGDDWWRTIVQAIRKASAFVVIMTDESDASEWVQREVTLADKYQIPPFPLWLSGDFNNSDNWAIYVRTQYADVRSGELPLDEFYDRLAAVAPRKQQLGEDVTPATFEPMPTKLESELAHDMANPPLPDTVSVVTAPDLSAQRSISYSRLAVILGIIALVVVILSLLILSNLNQPRGSPTEAALNSTNTITPSSTLTFTPAPIGFPGNPVTKNAAWKPQYQTFNDAEMALVPVGCFMMGSELGNVDEKPVNQQCFDQPYWIDRYEVTNKQFGSEGNFKGDKYPRDSVTWFQARDFCIARGARLPTEREWEYAARGPDNLIYPWGNDFVAENVAYSNFLDQTVPVGSRPSGLSWIGGFDFSGNILEWVHSIYQPYPYKQDDGREGDVEGEGGLRVYRGGLGRLSVTSNLRTSIRFAYSPNKVDRILGFRCARDYDG